MSNQNEPNLKVAPAALAQHKPKLLIVDDEAMNIRVLGEALRVDYELIIAKSAQDALDILYSGDRPHLILLDVMMPGINGFALCREIKARKDLEHIPVIFITALEDLESEEQGFEVGGVDYIQKPINPSLVRARVRTHISTHGMLDNLIGLNQELNEKLTRVDQLAWRIKKQQNQLDKSENLKDLFESVITATSEGIVVTDATGKVLAVNGSFSRITGLERADIVGQNLRMLRDYTYDESFYDEVLESVRKSGSWTGETFNRRKNGEVYPELRTVSAIRANDGQITHYLTVFNDITNLKETEKRVEELTWRDPVTGLPNRALFLDQLGAALKYCHSCQVTAAVLVVDINGFKLINESHGYQTGDSVLKEFSERLGLAVNKDDSIARLSGDEFGILVTPQRWSPDDAYTEAAALVEKICNQMQKPMNVYELGKLPIEVTIGIALYPTEASQNPELVLQHAETARHAAKGDSRIFAFFEDSMSEEVKRQIRLESELVQAIEDAELVLYAQPQYTPDLSICGYEVLVRWDHRERGIVGPGEFIPFAEKSRLIVKLERYVIEQSLRYLVDLQAFDHESTCSINISARHFAEDDFVDSMEMLLHASGVDPKRLVLELTETVMVHDVETVCEKMNKLKALGCSLSLDDFGTGYSSLSLLRRLPIDEIKIDRSFVLSALQESTSANIVEMITRLGETMQVRIVAEGTETLKHVEFLRSRYPKVYFQGFYFGRPKPFQDIIDELGA